MTPAARVIDELLVLRAGERLLIVHDEANADIAAGFERAASEARALTTRLQMEPLAPRPWTTCPTKVLAAVPAADATILAAVAVDGEYDARLALVTAAAAARARHVHMVGVSRRAFVASMGTTTARVFGLLDALRAQLRPKSRFTIRSAAGTRLEIEMAPHLRWFANGNAVRAGQWVNVPYGALVSSPANVRGVYVADAAMGGALGARVGLLTGRPVRLTITDNRVTGVECRDVSVKDYVGRFVAQATGHDRIGLVGLGANIGILSPLGEIIHDENMPGVHLALGEPFPLKTGATWSAHGQLAFAATDMDVDLDAQPLIRRSRHVR
jgi:leucyl aminopeptidase (aminopeptidase T)